MPKNTDKLPKTVRKYAEKIMHWDDEREAGNSLIITLASGWCLDDKGTHVFGVSTVAEAKQDLQRVMPCDCARCFRKV
jgi:predicted ATP-grasp superfamily ATP-dependent carboligase